MILFIASLQNQDKELRDSFKSLHNDFKENEYENTIKRNFGNSISRKIISKILQTQ